MARYTTRKRKQKQTQTPSPVAESNTSARPTQEAAREPEQSPTGLLLLLFGLPALMIGIAVTLKMTGLT